MYTIKTTVKYSEINGLGCFAAENLLKGRVVWVFSPRFDLLFTKEEVEDLPEPERELVKFYGYLDTLQFKGFYVLHVGNDRFTNHSDNPNLETHINEYNQYVMVAGRDIMKGDELTCDYREYEQDRDFMKLDNRSNLKKTSNG